MVIGIEETDGAVVVTEVEVEGEIVAVADEVETDGEVVVIKVVVEGEIAAVVDEVTLVVENMLNFYSTQ